MKLFASVILVLVNSSIVMATDIEPSGEFASSWQEQPVTPPEYSPEYQEPVEDQELEYSPYTSDSNEYFDEFYSG
ncbi:MAG: hypothetical protein LBJ71_02335 [Holosporaceae bacterium]|jgi:hypothetical protein|nr:hypothetical protein [Holosporaceae bacterium]